MRDYDCNVMCATCISEQECEYGERGEELDIFVLSIFLVVLSTRNMQTCVDLIAFVDRFELCNIFLRWASKAKSKSSTDSQTKQPRLYISRTNSGRPSHRGPLPDFANQLHDCSVVLRNLTSQELLYEITYFPCMRLATITSTKYMREIPTIGNWKTTNGRHSSNTNVEAPWVEKNRRKDTAIDARRIENNAKTG